MCESTLVSAARLVHIELVNVARAPALMLLLALPGSGCGDAAARTDADGDQISGGQTGEESLGCAAVNRQPLAAGAVSPLGFSANQLFEALGTQQSITLTWAEGGTTRLAVTIDASSAEVEFIDRELGVAPGGREPAGEVAIDCSDVLSAELTLRFVTDDGAFDETWSVTLSADTLTTARVFHRFDASALSGSFRVTQVDAAEFDELRTYLSLSFVEHVWSGSLHGEGLRGAGAGLDGEVSSTPFAIATF